ncbi:MAG: 4-alpha-glucanotransferase [Elusimicrobia bacterium GWA2_69_24]|nr:MAG: 4-alpha-glucanotransferase [Elusimicrobia bacterium GWA2_69_24]
MNNAPCLREKRAGVVLPLSALRSGSDAGVGDTAALVPFFDWMRSAGLSVLQLLPLHDLGPSDSCPYTALSAFALDSAFISLGDVPEIQDSPSLRRAAQAALRGEPALRLRRARRVPFAEARRFKWTLLEKACAAFERRHLGRNSHRADAFAAFCRRHRSWLEDYALFRALKEEHSWSSWRQWPRALQDREPAALDAARRRLAGRIRFHQYLQWNLFAQWDRVRRAAAERGILLFGDIPFGLSVESADVWSHADLFDFSVSMGAPPDQYSVTGQAWGLPAYRWEVMEEGGHLWWRERLRHTRDLYDIFRIDHAVGFFRTWLVRPKAEESAFDIVGREQQWARGRRFFTLALEEGRPAGVAAEDLGLIPDFMKETLEELGIPGYKVTRWQDTEDGYLNPRNFPRVSVATTGNHDTSSLAAWWAEIPQEARDDYWEMVRGKAETAPRFSHAVQMRILRNLYEAGSALALVSFQDLFGSRARVNIPGTITNRNWTYRMPWPVEDLLRAPRSRRATTAARRLAVLGGRLPAEPGPIPPT